MGLSESQVRGLDGRTVREIIRLRRQDPAERDERQALIARCAESRAAGFTEGVRSV